MTSIKYDHLQVMRTITGKFHQNSLKTVGVGETRLCLGTDGRTDGQKDGRTDESKTTVPFDLRRGGGGGGGKKGARAMLKLLFVVIVLRLR